MEYFRGRRALVTGASGGLGAEFTRILAAEGVDLILTARSGPSLEPLAKDARARGVDVVVLPADLAQPDAADRLAARIAELGLSVDILVNNAGFGVFGPVLASAPADEAAMVSVNVSALTRLTRLAADGMVRRGWGRILEVASIAAFQPTPLYAVYAATKAYVLSFGLALNRELRGTGVTVTVLNPGVTRTGFFHAAGQMGFGWFQRLTMMEPRAVAVAALHALHAQRPMVTTGAANKIVSFLTRFSGRSLAASIAMRNMPFPEP